MSHKRAARRMVKIDATELRVMKEKELALFCEGLCSIRYANKKSRELMAEWLEVSVKHYDKIKQGIAWAPLRGWITVSKRLNTEIIYEYIEVQKQIV